MDRETEMDGEGEDTDGQDSVRLASSLRRSLSTPVTESEQKSRIRYRSGSLQSESMAGGTDTNEMLFGSPPMSPSLSGVAAGAALPASALSASMGVATIDLSQATFDRKYLFDRLPASVIASISTSVRPFPPSPAPNEAGNTVVFRSAQTTASLQMNGRLVKQLDSELKTFEFDKIRPLWLNSAKTCQLYDELRCDILTSINLRKHLDTLQKERNDLSARLTNLLAKKKEKKEKEVGKALEKKEDKKRSLPDPAESGLDVASNNNASSAASSRISKRPRK
eukprot:TRINITY_DN6018_c0_g1_i5.p1 TRINITY_DN6018_c0_g1~~TRINITY_DN6018_c0_g1_i5.p1  ORF type:complete len:280 (-),score=44.84 TRINITY_DN6018_c0_g1_i5:184-1023(-)